MENGKWALIVSALDEIAWLLNIRGNDVEYNPVVISYVVLEADKCTLFVNPDKIGCIGFSGGGMQTLWLSAMDDRIGISVISILRKRKEQSQSNSTDSP